MKQYDVSVVIPVYNSEEYIEQSVKSIYNQEGIDVTRIEVLLINDGSTDNSLEICNKLKEQYKNELEIKIISGENQGVSVTRNKGIKAAKGKYIMFIDSDDYISNNTLKNLISFFDEHYDEIDLVTYPMYESHEDKKKNKILQRYKDYFDNTRVYDLNEEYEVIQPTMNIIVKNYYEKNILFDEKVNFNEDTLYNTQILMQKMKLGYVKEAKYIYRIHNSSATNTRENPLYSFEQYMYVFEKLFNDYKDSNGKLPKYIQRLYLNVLRYRINKDKLLPYYLDGEEYEKAWNRIISLIKQIQNTTILQFKQMDKYHKAYLISIKNDKDLNITKSYDGLVYSINYKNKILFNENSIEIVVNKLELKDDKLYILGYLKSVLCRYKKPNLYLKCEKDQNIIYEQQIELSENTITNRYKSEIEVAKFYKFEILTDISDIDTVKLQVEFEKTKFKTKYIFTATAPMSNKLKNYMVYFRDGYRIKLKKDGFLIEKTNKKTRFKDFVNNVIKYYRINKKVDLFRIIALIQRSLKRKTIWLYYDRKNVFDNGYEQFKHDIKIKDNIKKYYILDGKINNFRDMFSIKEQKHVVKFGSLKHKLLFLNSDKILTAFSSLQEYSPFHKKFLLYKDILRFELVYLQHGVLHAKLLKMYGKEFAPIDKFVISSQFEKDNLINNYGYSKKDLICTGMPRLDKKIENVEPENKIIFAPSWREYLIGKAINRKREIDEKKFMNSKYYKETMSFLTNIELLNVLEKNNITLDYKLHPIFEGYAKCFETAKSKNVTVSIGGTDLSKCKAFITDFSSFQFDFVRLERPIVYFMPDMKEFKAGLHTYRELDLKYEDAFGNLCLTSEELVEEITKIIDRDFEPEPIYKDRMEKFFFKVKYRKDRLYDILKEG